MRDETPLCRAIEAGHQGLVKLLLEKGANPNLSRTNGCGLDEAPLYLAVCNKTGVAPAMVELLQEKGADVNKSTKDATPPLHGAIKYGNEGLVKLLLEKGADVNGSTRINKWTALHQAAASGNTTIVKLLLEKGALLNPLMSDGMTPLQVAIQRNHTAIVRQLVEKGAEIMPNN